MSKKIFITGATGLLGSHIAQSLLEAGFSLVCSKRTNSDLTACESFKNQVDWVEMDILDVNQVKENIKDVAWVVHSAALVSFNPKDNKNLDTANRIGTENIVNACIENKVPNLFFVSSIAALGRAGKNKKIDENTKWEESSLNSAYSVSKYQSENEVWRGMQEGLNVSIINPSVILGPGDINRSSTQLFQFVAKYKNIYPEGYLNVVDVRDVAKISTTLIKNKIVGERYILDSGSVSYQDFLGEVAKHTAMKKPAICFSKRKAYLAYPLFQLLAFLTRKPSFLTKQSIKLMGLQSHYNTSKVEKKLNFTFTPWKESVTWVCNELKLSKQNII